MSISADEFDESVRLLEAGDAAGAAVLLEEISVREPENGRAFQYLGVARSQAGDLAGGAAALRRSAELLPDRPVIWFNLGVALTRIGETAEAQAALERALALDPANAKARAALDAMLPRTQAALPQSAAFMPEPPDPAPQLRSLSSAPAEQAKPVQKSLGNNWASQNAALPASGQVGSQYAPSPMRVHQSLTSEPSTGQRIFRGLGWGFVCGQWWTLLNTFWELVYGGASAGFGAVAVLVIVFAVVFGIAGSLAGLIIGALDADVNAGAIIGIVFGLLLFAFEFFVLNGAKMSALFNGFFWFFTGRYVGATIARRIQARR